MKKTTYNILKIGTVLDRKLVILEFIGKGGMGGFKFQYNEQTKGEIGFWGQARYQYVEDGQDSNGDGIGDKGLNDFMIRRAYLYIKGEATPYFSFFTHIAADRVGQDGLDNPSVGLGSGVAFRDLWITLKPDEAFKIQAGRMYVPFTRNYGTTSTKALLTTDLDWAQGAFTVEGAYIDIDNGPNAISDTQFVSGDDGSIVSLKAGYLFMDKFGPGQFQPFAHWQYIDVNESGKDSTNVYGFGLNYFLKGHANKLSLDFTYIDQKEEILSQDIQDRYIVTLQIAAGF